MTDIDGRAASYLEHYWRVTKADCVGAFICGLVGAALMFSGVFGKSSNIIGAFLIVGGTLLFGWHSFKQAIPIKEERVGIWFKGKDLRKIRMRLLLFPFAGLCLGTFSYALYLVLVIHIDICIFLFIMLPFSLFGIMWGDYYLNKWMGIRVRYFKIGREEHDKRIMEGLNRGGFEPTQLSMAPDQKKGLNVRVNPLSVVIFTSKEKNNQSKATLMPDDPANEENILRLEEIISSVAKDI